MKFTRKNFRKITVYGGRLGEKYFLDRTNLLYRMFLNGEKINQFVIIAIDQCGTDDIVFKYRCSSVTSVYCALVKNKRTSNCNRTKSARSSILCKEYLVE